MSTFVLPTYVCDPTVGPPHIPAYVIDGALIGTTVWPKYTSGTRAFTFIPAYLMSPSFLNFTPSGGMRMSGNADIFGDPFFPTDGMVMGGSATVEFIPVFQPSGGMRMAGAAVVTSFTTPYLTGGMKMGGNPLISAVLVNIYNIGEIDAMPVGGMLMEGSAVVGENITFVPTGGMKVGGEAIIQEAIQYVPTGGMAMSGSAEVAVVFAPEATGGMVMGGTAPMTVKYVEAPSGGMMVGGTAPESFRESLYVPSGGMKIGGGALAYMIPSGIVTTTENPFGDAFPGWAINFETNAASRYMNLPANSIAQFGGRTFVANAGGIYEVGADDDAGQPIRASIEFPTTDYQDSHEKRMEVAYIGVKSAGNMRLKVKVLGLEPQYYVLVPGSSGPKGTRVKIGKGLVGRYWGSRLDNVNGADFELESVEFNPVAGQRHGA